MEQIKLSAWAKKMGIHYRTAQKWYYDDKIIGAYKAHNGRVYVRLENKTDDTKNTIIYARVSSHDQKADLERQVKRLEDYAAMNGLTIIRVVKEVASGMNDSRPKLMSILNDIECNCILVEHKDRLTRFGFNYIEQLSKRLGLEIKVINQTNSNKENIIEDFISVITSFCARIYGSRRGKRKSTAITEIIKS